MTADLEQRIVGLDLWHVALPVRSRRIHAIGTVEGMIEVVIVRLTAESGEVGYGEAAPWSVFTGTPEAAYAALDRYMRPCVVGARVCDGVAITNRASGAVAFASDASAALETALLDLTGRIADVPVWALLGGKCRDTIPLSVSLAGADFGADLALVDRVRADGVGIVKLKMGVATHAEDLRRLETLACENPGLDIRVDYNQGLPPDVAVTRVRDVARLAPTFVEQPVRAHQFSLMARIRETAGVPILADESVFGPEEMRRAIAEGICDGVSVKIMKAGGLRRARAVAEMAGSAGLAAYGGDMFETGLAHLAGVHMVASAPDITLGCEFYQARYFLKEDILTVPVPYEGGVIRVPDGPGLGILPDEQKLTRHALRTTVAA